MSEQYAFAIAFEQYGADSDAQVSSSDWSSLMSQIEQAIEFEGFPSFADVRWEEFGDGYIFWGSKLECNKLKNCISAFPVSIYEERNLDAGYYTCSFGVYYVDNHGNILGLDSRTPSFTQFDIHPRETIPLEAFKAKNIAPEIEEQFQQALLNKNESLLTQDALSAEEEVATISLMSEQEDNVINSGQPLPASASIVGTPEPDTSHIAELEHQIAQLRQALTQEQIRAEAKVSPEVVASLNQVVNDQNNRLRTQEQIIDQHQSQMHDLQLMLDRKVDPEVHSHLQQHATAQTEEISELEQELQQLKQAHAQVLASESQRISAAEYEKLGHVSAEQGKTIIDLEATVQTLQAKLDTAQHEIANKVDNELFQKALAEKEQQSELIHQLQIQAQRLAEQLQQGTEKVDQSDYDSMNREKIQLETQLQTLEQDKQQLLEEVGKWSRLANAKVEPEKFDTLQQKAVAQTQQITKLQTTVDQLQQDVTHWKQISAEKIERKNYEAALAEIERIRALRSRSWFEKIKNWFLG